MNRYSSAICSRDNLILFATFIWSNRLMTAFLACFKIHQGNVSDLYLSLSDNSGLTRAVEWGSQFSDRIFKEPLKGILVYGIKCGLLVITVKRKQKRWLEPISLQNMDSTEAVQMTWKKNGSLSAWDLRLLQGRFRKPQWTLTTLLQ